VTPRSPSSKGAASPAEPTFTAFVGYRRLTTGALRKVALAVKHAAERGVAEPLFIYDDATGGLTDVDVRGTDGEVVARLTVAASTPWDDRAPSPAHGTETRVVAVEAADHTGKPVPEPRRRGRPTLGVVGREVTLLPRHWEWLNAQPGGASVALRKLVEEARRVNVDRDRTRQEQARAFRFMSSIGGDLPGYEEIVRALFAEDRTRFDALIASWPADVAAHATRLAFSEGRSA
jgi:hypothetical protein